MRYLLLLFPLLSISWQLVEEDYVTDNINITCSVPVCDGPLSSIYCQGEILRLAWSFGLQATCPGNKLKFKHDVVEKNFELLPKPVLKEAFEKFCSDNFEKITFLKPVNLSDWDPNPSFLNVIPEKQLKLLATELNNRWKLLGRKFVDEIFRSPERYPVIPVKNAFIVPGGRFDLYFYWDSYWIIKGLLSSGMFTTSRNIIQNFADLVNQLGYIPNSGDLQLSKRSQPPLFTHMIYDYYQETKKISDVKRWLPSIETEMQFWEQNRTLTVNGATVFVYRATSDCPRPENLLGDVELARNVKNPKKLWRSIASACESGLDFSSRWFSQNVSKKAISLSTTHTDEIVPVDLNVFMALNYKYLSELYIAADDLEAAGHWRREFKNLKASIDQLMWNSTSGTWFDYDTTISKHNTNFYPSNVFPLLLGSSKEQINIVEQYLKNSTALDYAGGIPASLNKENSGQQWDLPNSWPPSQHLFVKSLVAGGSDFFKETARSQATKFLKQVYNGLFKPTVLDKGAIWEKYDVLHDWGIPGHGGEYKVQDGFGWTNGAALDLIRLFNDVRLEDDTVFNATNMTIAGITLTVVICVLIFTSKGIRKVTPSGDDSERQPLTQATQED